MPTPGNPRAQFIPARDSRNRRIPTRRIRGKHVNRSSKAYEHPADSDRDLIKFDILFFLDFKALKSALVIELGFLAVPM